MDERRVVQPIGLQLSSLAQPHITEVKGPSRGHPVGVVDRATMVFEAGLGAPPDELAGSHAGQASFPITTKVGTISFTSPRPDRGEHAGRARAGPDFRNCVGDHPRHADFHIASIYQQIDAARARAASDPQLSGAPNQAFSWPCGPSKRNPGLVWSRRRERRPRLSSK
ncbi:MAG: hypothetical protein WA375_07705 [Pseudolabrys sp.]